MYNENRYYYQRNILGDITHIYSEDGVLVAKYVYDAIFGNPDYDKWIVFDKN